MTELPLPTIKKRVSVINEVHKELPPIKVFYLQSIDRVNQLVTITRLEDFSELQRRLHGSLLVQVNDCPKKIAEVFLGDPYHPKFQKAFEEFLDALKEAVPIHGSLTKSVPATEQLQVELETSMERMNEEISKCLQPVDVHGGNIRVTL